MARDLKRHQHLDPHRKYLLRKRMLRWAVDGPVYLPFCGDGDIAVGGQEDATRHEAYPCPGVYQDRYVYGADLDEQRVATCRSRIENGLIRLADCDSWPFADVSDIEPFAVADFDAWAEPYPCFRAFWKQAPKADRLVMFFTDAHRMGIMADGTHIRPDGSKKDMEDLNERRAVYHFYLSKHVWPWFDGFIAPYRVVDRMRYNRGMLTYWSVALEKQL